MASDIKISHLIPLHHSRRFADVIATNVAELAGPDTEILLADRNGDEAFCEDLRAQFTDVPNLRVICDATDATWVGNIAGLLGAARGAIIKILPHDDGTTIAATDAMCAALDTAPDAVLAYGRVRAFALAGAPLPNRDELNSAESAEATGWALNDALPLLWTGRFNGAFKGVIRRATAQLPACRFTATTSTALSERAWLFSLALQGRFQFVPMDVLYKRYYPDSTHHGWTVTAETHEEATQLMINAINHTLHDPALRSYAIQDMRENCAAKHRSMQGCCEKFRYTPATDPAQNRLRGAPIAWGTRV